MRSHLHYFGFLFCIFFFRSDFHYTIPPQRKEKFSSTIIMRQDLAALMPLIYLQYLTFKREVCVKRQILELSLSKLLSLCVFNLKTFCFASFSLQCQANLKISPFWMCRLIALQCPGIRQRTRMEPLPAIMFSTYTTIKLASRLLRIRATRPKHSYTSSCRV